jgi:hypothetical protein
MLVIKELPAFMQEFVSLGKITVGVGVYGSAAAYALVWELGSRRLKSPGPKTMWSTNRDGERAILTTQAPHGYVTPTDEFWPIIEEEVGRINFGNAKTSKEAALRLEVALDNASHRIAAIIAQRAPVDSGDLRSQIMGIDADEMQSMSIEDSEDSGTLII